MSQPVISVENLSKAYRLGQIGTGTVDMRHVMYSFVFMPADVFLGTIVFNRVEQTFMDTV